MIRGYCHVKNKLQSQQEALPQASKILSKTYVSTCHIRLKRCIHITPKASPCPHSLQSPRRGGSLEVQYSLSDPPGVYRDDQWKEPGQARPTSRLSGITQPHVLSSPEKHVVPKEIQLLERIALSIKKTEHTGLHDQVTMQVVKPVQEVKFFVSYHSRQD